jgi:hypothetical protein
MKKLSHLLFLLAQMFMAQTSAQCLVLGDMDLGNIYYESGSANVDRLIESHGRNLSKMLDVQPVVRYSRSEVVNALAAGDGLDRDGTVYILKGMIDDCLAGDDLRLIAVLAHEYAHIFCSKYGVRGQLTRMEEELYCDYIAGLYLMQFVLGSGGYNPDPFVLNERFSRLIQLNKEQGRFGDYYFDSPEHHGTPDQRQKAMFSQFSSMAALAQHGVSGPGPHFINGRYMTSMQFSIWWGFDKLKSSGYF